MYVDKIKPKMPSSSREKNIQINQKNRVFQKVEVKLTTVTLVHTVIRIKNDPLRDKIPEVFLA